MDIIQIERRANKLIISGEYAEAQRLMEIILHLDSEFALMNLAWMHESGKAIHGDAGLAKLLYQRATEIGCLEAYNCLGQALRNGGDFQQARIIFENGANLGNVGSMSWLGCMMLWGEGGPKSTEEAKRWLIFAAEKGHFVARGQLLILKRQNSKSPFRGIIYQYQRFLLALEGYNEYTKNPQTENVF